MSGLTRRWKCPRDKNDSQRYMCLWFALKENIRQEGPAVRPSWFSFLVGSFKPIYLNLSFLLYESNVATVTSFLWSLNKVPAQRLKLKKGKYSTDAKPFPPSLIKLTRDSTSLSLPSSYFENSLTELTSTLEARFQPDSLPSEKKGL